MGPGAELLDERRISWSVCFGVIGNTVEVQVGIMIPGKRFCKVTGLERRVWSGEGLERHARLDRGAAENGGAGWTAKSGAGGSA